LAGQGHGQGGRLDPPRPRCGRANRDGTPSCPQSPGSDSNDRERGGVVIDRRNRRDLTIFGLLLMAAGALSAALGGGVFGDHRANEDVFDLTVIRWWDEGGWESFAVVTA